MISDDELPDFTSDGVLPENRVPVLATIFRLALNTCLRVRGADRLEILHACSDVLTGYCRLEFGDDFTPRYLDDLKQKTLQHIAETKSSGANPVKTMPQ